MCRIDVRPSGARRMIAVYRRKHSNGVPMSRGEPRLGNTSG